MTALKHKHETITFLLYYIILQYVCCKFFEKRRVGIDKKMKEKSESSARL